MPVGYHARQERFFNRLLGSHGTPSPVATGKIRGGGCTRAVALSMPTRAVGPGAEGGHQGRRALARTKERKGAPTAMTGLAAEVSRPKRKNTWPATCGTVRPGCCLRGWRRVHRVRPWGAPRALERRLEAGGSRGLIGGGARGATGAGVEGSRREAAGPAPGRAPEVVRRPWRRG